jgi:5-methylcytosine-specific restriction endonuclease McrA
MSTNILTTAIALSDDALLNRIADLAGAERETTAELVAHLAVLEQRPSLYVAQGHGSLFAYCTQALRLSEDAAYNRISVARACRQFPVILDLLASGEVSLTSVRKLQPHLTPENHQTVLARARRATKGEIDLLVAELAPRPDAASTVRRLPVTTLPGSAPSDGARKDGSPSDGELNLSFNDGPPAPSPVSDKTHSPLSDKTDGTESRLVSPHHAAPSPCLLAKVEAWAPDRHRVHFTIDDDTHAKLQRLQALLRREIPSGDPGAIYNRGLDLLLEKVERAKLGRTAPRQRKAASQPEATIDSKVECTESNAETTVYEFPTRSETGTSAMTSKTADRHPARQGPSRHIPNGVKRAVWQRDQGRCAFVVPGGRRCDERSFLEFHHVRPYALDGPATLGNIALRCRRHNAYEAELVFGSRDQQALQERPVE